MDVLRYSFVLGGLEEAKLLLVKDNYTPVGIIIVQPRETFWSIYARGQQRMNILWDINNEKSVKWDDNQLNVYKFVSKVADDPDRYNIHILC